MLISKEGVPPSKVAVIYNGTVMSGVREHAAESRGKQTNLSSDASRRFFRIRGTKTFLKPRFWWKNAFPIK